MSFKKNTLNYVFGVLIEKLIPFLMLPFFTHFLGSDEYAKLIMFLTYNAIFTILIGFSSDAYYVREILDSNKSSNILSVPLIFNFMMFTLLFLFSIIMENEIMLLAACLSLLQTIFNYCLSYYLALKKSKKYVILSIYFSLIATVLSMILIYIFRVYEARVIALLFAMIVSIALFAWKEPIFLIELKNNFTEMDKITKVAWYAFLSFCFPLAIHQLAFFMKSGFDRILMDTSETASFLSAYGLAFQLVLPLPVLFGAFNKAFLPHIYEKLNQNNINYARKIINFSWLLIFVSIVSFFITMSIPAWVYAYLFGKGFETVSMFLPYFLAGSLMALPYLLSNFILFYQRKTKWIAFANIVSAIIHITLFIFLNSKEYIHYLGLSYLISQYSLFVFVNMLSHKELNTLKIEIEKGER